ncbi:MAG: hypothetical protein P4M09_20360 [Devosia sp.]|nr:hypothetical protein [Devosia sp.]
MPSKEEQYKDRLSGILHDLSTTGDAEARLLVGSLAAQISGHARTGSWTAFKAGLTLPTYRSLLTSFQTQGNDLARQGQHRQVQAIEVLAVSLVGKTQLGDPEVASSLPALDKIIDDAILAFRQAQAADPIIS